MNLDTLKDRYLAYSQRKRKPSTYRAITDRCIKN